MQQTITRRIRQRTNGRIQLLMVEVKGDTVTVRGRSPSYFIKQLALQGVLDVLTANGSVQFEHKIEVAGNPARCEAGKSGSPALTNELRPPYIPLPDPEDRADAIRAAQMEYAEAARETCGAGYWN
jgi:hypothetical protein